MSFSTTSRRRLGYLAAAAVAATTLTALPGPAAAAVGGCRTVRPQNDFYEAGRVASELLTVPPGERCTTISVRAVRDPQDPGPRCVTFLVGFFPPEGESSYTEPVRVCSPGRRVVLAAGVPDGSVYRVLYEIEYLGQSLRYAVAH